MQKGSLGHIESVVVPAKGQRIVTGLLAALLSFFLVAGYGVSHELIAHATAVDVALFVVVLLVVAALLFAALSALWHAFDALMARKVLGRTRVSQRLAPLFSSRFSWPIVAVALLLCWLPVLLAGWPGFYCYDTDAVEAWARDGAYDSNQPFFWVFCLGMAFRLAWSVGASSNAAIALLCIVSGVAAAVVLSRIVIWVARRYSPTLAALSFLFFVCNPLISCFAWGSGKDLYFALVLIVAMRYLVSGQKGARPGVLLVVFMTLCCLFRNNAIFALVVGLPFVLALLPERRKAYAVGLVAAALVAGVVGGPVAHSLSTSVSPSTTLLAINSVPTQHLSFIWKSDRVTEEDKDAILGLANSATEQQIADSRHTLDHAVPTITDASRGAFMTELMLEPDPARFYRGYVPLAAKYPREFVDAWLHLTYESWYPASTIDSYNNEELGPAMGYDKTETSLFACMVESPGQLDSKLPALHDFLYQVSRFNVLQANLLTAWLVSVPFYVWLTLIAAARACMRRSRLRVPFVLLVGLLLTFALGPCVMVRYYLPLMFLFPVLLCACLDGGVRFAPARGKGPKTRHARHERLSAERA